jgi:hypothetical protein
MKTQLIRSALTGLALTFAVSTDSQAALFEGFESLTLSVPAVGDAGPVDGDFFTPFQATPQGSRQLLLSTTSFAADGGNLSGSDAASVATVESFLALQTGAIPDGGSLGDASAVKLAVTLGVGDVLSFQYRFLTSATVLDGMDFAFYTLQIGAGIPVLVTFADTVAATTPSTSANFDFESGVATVTLPAAGIAGSYTLGFGIADHTDDAIQSGVLIDNVQIVPEPTSALLLLLGLGGLGSLRRRSVRVN